MKVEKQIPSELVEWTCLEGPPEWVGTSLTFNFSQVDDYVVLLFSHRNWKEEVEFMHHCSTKWAVFLMSLKELLEKGKGHPSPYDVKIDNWN